MLLPPVSQVIETALPLGPGDTSPRYHGTTATAAVRPAAGGPGSFKFARISAGHRWLAGQAVPCPNAGGTPAASEAAAMLAAATRPADRSIIVANPLAYVFELSSCM